MPAFVNPEKCVGCKACMHICPNDLMLVDADAKCAYNQEPDACWECYACVKICPHAAVAVRPYADFCPLGSLCAPTCEAESISWSLQFRNGASKHFHFPTRTVAKNAIKPFADQTTAGALENELLFTEKELAQPQKTICKKIIVQDPDQQQTIILPGGPH